MAENTARQGRLKIFLGYAAGVGKTYQMLVEARERAAQGVDVVIGYFEPHGRRDTIAMAEGLEIIPRKMVEYRGSVFEDMDTEAVLRRKPALCIVDELAHTNVPGLPRTKRWEDVLVLLEAGIDVYTTVNVQHLESLNDQVHHFTGIRVRETLPDWVVKQADEVVMIDLTPEALLNRLARGAIYSPEKAKQATANFFKEPTLVALRELALRQTAHEVDVRQAREEEEAAGPKPGTPAADTEKVLIVLSEEPATAALIRRGRRVADYLRAECFATFVCPEGDLSRLPRGTREAVEDHLNFARNLQIETRVLAGSMIAETTVDFARRNGITQILIGRPGKSRVPMLVARYQPAFKLLRLAHEFQVTIVANRQS
jgi:two-component system, OmpR family, sensor histidine kinase KdpD